MANDIISDDLSNYYVEIRDDELVPYTYLFEIAQIIYERGLQEAWITSSEYGNFMTMKEAAAIVVINNKNKVQQEAGARLFYALSEFLSLISIDTPANGPIKLDAEKLQRIPADEYLICIHFIRELRSFLRNSLRIDIKSPLIKI